ncbi:MAG: alpha/beta hydrolase [Nevskiaceae bacterium]|nr:MAG: alpha/beta hydrolase [Nevskiaceae bacterium]
MAVAVDDPLLQRRPSFRRRSLNRLMKTAAVVGGFLGERKADRDDIEVIRDLSYGPHPFNRLDVYRPRFAPRPLPVLLYIHGGAFSLCSKETHRGIARASARGGQYLVFNIDYRLAPRFQFPCAHEDACLAFAWVAAHCARFGGDPSRVVVAGESAGGNLALSVAIAACYRRPEPWAQVAFAAPVRLVGVKPIMPYLQVTNAARQNFNPGAGWLALRAARDIAKSYLGSSRVLPSRETMMADPIRILEECGAPEKPFPPVFSGVGTWDVCCEDVQRLERACERLGVPARMHYYEREIHAFHVLAWRDNARRYWQQAFAFMREVATA